MVPLLGLWIPVLVSAVVVFFASSIIHMALKYHRKDFLGLPQEDAIRSALKGTARGQYMFPYCDDMKEMRSETMQKKFTEGPVGIITLRDPGMINMGPMLTQWLIYCLLISFFCAYIAHATIAVGTEYLKVFQVVGTVAWLGYGGSCISQGIWQSRPWKTVTKDVFDGLVYGLLTAGVFGWLWPR
jgi:hypothetical protein